MPLVVGATSSRLIPSTTRSPVAQSTPPGPKTTAVAIDRFDAAGGSTTRSGATVLRMGARGESVKLLQRLLQSRGIDPGPLDGIFGRKTAAAVRQFQREARIAVDGLVGPQTWAALRNGEKVDATPEVPAIDSRQGQIAPFEVFPLKATLVKEFPKQRPAGLYKKIGDNYDPDYDSKGRKEKSGHHGTDIYATMGTELVAPFDGEVVLVRTDRAKGMAVALKRADGIIVRFTHLDQIEGDLRQGMRIEAGTKVGEVGKTGTSSVHLHFSMYRDGYYNSINPYPFLKAAEQSAKR